MSHGLIINIGTPSAEPLYTGQAFVVVLIILKCTGGNVGEGGKLLHQFSSSKVFLSTCSLFCHDLLCEAAIWCLSRSRPPAATLHRMSCQFRLPMHAHVRRQNRQTNSWAWANRLILWIQHSKKCPNIHVIISNPVLYVSWCSRNNQVPLLVQCV